MTYATYARYIHEKLIQVFSVGLTPLAPNMYNCQKAPPFGVEKNTSGLRGAFINTLG